MKFLIATGNYPPEIGGPATVMAPLAAELRALGHDVQVVTYGTRREGDDVFRVSRRGSVLARYARFATAMRRAIQPDVTVLATDVFSVGIPTRLALMGKPNRFVVRLGGEWMWEDAVTNGGLNVTLREYWATHASGSRHGLKTRLASWVLRRSSRLIITSDMLRVPLASVSPSAAAEAVTVCNIPRRTSCVAAPHVASDTLRVLYSGRFAPVKNVPFFCRALKRAIEERGAKISMVFVGEGTELRECQELFAGSTAVRFVGAKAPREVDNLLSEADLYVLPSLSDICPNGVLEALGCGVPCLITTEHGLGTDLGGVIELSPKEEDAWVETLVELAANPTKRDALRQQIRLPAPSADTLLSVLTASSPRQ